jgi:hypothetical protein
VKATTGPAHWNGTRKSEPRPKPLSFECASETRPRARRGTEQKQSNSGVVVVSNTSIPVLDENRNCLGHVIRRDHASVEAFDVADVSLGLFQDEREAAAEVWRRRRCQQHRFSKTRCHHDGASRT